MLLHSLTPMLCTWGLPGTLAYYTNNLGFTCVSGSVEAGWAELFRDGIEVMISAPNAHLDEHAPVFTGSFYFRTDAVDGWWAALGTVARVCYPIEDFDYGMREFAVYDNNGYLLQFGQPLP
jgi:uncharacterized glyoxalase superfamily protein PhnB